MKNKILIVDDDILFAKALEASLLEKGFEVHIENTGDIGEKEMIENTYDVILLDIMIPERTGVEIVENLKDRKEILNKIMIMTSLADQHYLPNVLELGVKTYIEKNTTTPDEIADKVSDMLH